MQANPSQRSLPSFSPRKKNDTIATISGMVPGSSGPTSAAGTKRIALPTMKKKMPPEPRKQIRNGPSPRFGHKPTLSHHGASTTAGTTKRSQPTVKGGR